jgi:hypothetical protein
VKIKKCKIGKLHLEFFTWKSSLGILHFLVNQ